MVQVLFWYFKKFNSSYFVEIVVSCCVWKILHLIFSSSIFVWEISYFFSGYFFSYGVFLRKHHFTININYCVSLFLSDIQNVEFFLFFWLESRDILRDFFKYVGRLVCWGIFTNIHFFFFAWSDDIMTLFFFIILLCKKWHFSFFEVLVSNSVL